MNDPDLAFERYRKDSRPDDLARVFDTCAPQLLLLASHVLGDGSAAEDVVQVTFLRAIEAADRFESGQRVLPWLIGILVREAKKHRRQAARTPDRDRLEEPTGERVPADLAELKEFQEAVSDALGRLPQAYREVLTLRLVHGLTPTEIAHLQGVSPQTIKTRLRRGTDRLRRILPPSFAAAVAAMTMAGYGLAHVREVVLGAAAAAAEGLVATAAGVAAEVAAESAAAAPQLAGTVTAATTTAADPLPLVLATQGRSLIGKVVLSAGFVAATTLGVIALDPFGGDPEVPLVEHREVIPDPAGESRALRSVAAAADPAPKPAVQVDPNLIAFHGRVVDGSGILGLDGMRIELVRLHPDLLVVAAAGLPGLAPSPRFVVGTTVTDDRGYFSFAGIPPSGTFLVGLATDKDTADWRLVPGSPAPGADVALGALRLGERRVMRGRIVDPQGFPVPRARLHHAGLRFSCATDLGVIGRALEQIAADEFSADGGVIIAAGTDTRLPLTVPAWLRDIYRRILVREVRTDEHGRFEWNTSRGEPVTLVVKADGFATRRVSFDVVGADHDVGSFRLDPLGEFAAVVRDGRGDPLPDAEVMVGPFVKSGCLPTRRAGRTDGDGEFRTPWDHRVQVMVAVRRGPGEPWHVRGPMSPVARQSIALPREFPVRLRAVRRNGSVRGPLDVQPMFRLVPARFEPERAVGALSLHQLGCLEPLDQRGRRSDEEDGVVRLDRVPAGDWTLLATAPGYASTSMGLLVDGNEDVTVELTPLATTIVKVVDARYKVAAGHPVYARALEERDRVHEFPVLVGRTDAEGWLALQRSPNRRYQVTAVSTELGCCSGRADSGVESVSVVMPPRGSVSGRLFEGGALPTPGWLVVARSMRVGERSQALPSPLVSTPVQADGRFELPPLEPGEWTLRAVKAPPVLSHPSVLLPLLFPESSEVPVRGVSVIAGRPQQVDVQASPPPEVAVEEKPSDEGPTTLHGTVRVEPLPVRGVKIAVQQPGGFRFFPVGPDGSFDTGLTLDGAVQVAVVTWDEAAKGGEPGNCLWSGAVADRRLVLDLSLLPMTFTLRTPDRRAVNGFDVKIRGRTGAGGVARFACRTDSDGWFELRMPAGRYSLLGEDATQGWIRKMDVEVSASLPLTFEVSPLVVAAGRAFSWSIGVDLPQGSEVRFQRVDEGVPIDRVAGLDLRGGFRVDGLLPGRYKVIVRPSMLVNGAIIPPSRHTLRVPQGEIQIGGGGRQGIELRQRSK